MSASPRYIKLINNPDVKRMATPVKGNKKKWPKRRSVTARGRGLKYGNIFPWSRNYQQKQQLSQVNQSCMNITQQNFRKEKAGGRTVDIQKRRENGERKKQKELKRIQWKEGEKVIKHYMKKTVRGTEQRDGQREKKKEIQLNKWKWLTKEHGKYHNREKTNASRNKEISKPGKKGE